MHLLRDTYTSMKFADFNISVYYTWISFLTFLWMYYIYSHLFFNSCPSKISLHLYSIFLKILSFFVHLNMKMSAWMHQKIVNLDLRKTIWAKYLVYIYSVKVFSPWNIWPKSWIGVNTIYNWKFASKFPPYLSNSLISLLCRFHY